MTHGLATLFSSNSGKLGDDGGYTKPLGVDEHFGASHANDFGGNFASVDFDKPLFGGVKEGGGDSGEFGGQSQPMRSLYSSSTGAK